MFLHFLALQSPYRTDFFSDDGIRSRSFPLLALLIYSFLCSFSPPSLSLSLSCSQIDKVIQLYETMLTRHCTMIVGPTGGGKTVCLNTLVKAQTNLGIPTKCITLNPKVSRLFVKF
jgi:Hydrolytic ATP binding site of dynein motor region